MKNKNKNRTETRATAPTEEAWEHLPETQYLIGYCLANGLTSFGSGGLADPISDPVGLEPGSRVGAGGSLAKRCLFSIHVAASLNHNPNTDLGVNYRNLTRSLNQSPASEGNSKILELGHL